MVSLRTFLISTLQRSIMTARLMLKVGRPLCLALPLWAVAHSAVHAENWKVNLQDADIKAFINEVAAITNQNFALDPRINGTVTVISNRALSKDEIYQLFLSVMRVNGIAAIEKDGIVEIVPENIAKQSGVAVDLQGDSVGNQLKTRVFYLNSIQAAEVLSVIRPLMPQSAHAAAVPGVNALVLSDHADSLNQLSILIRDLDSKNDDTLTTIPLSHVDAERMMDLINGLTESAGESGGGGGRIKVIADTASDRLLVTGNANMVAKIQEMVKQLDIAPSRRLSGVRTFPLKYADANYIADILRALLTEQSISVGASVSNVQQASLSSGIADNSKIGNTNENTGQNTRNLSANNNTQSATPRFNIIADERRNAVIVNSSPEMMLDIEETIQKLDARPQQVLIQAAIVEVSGNDAKQLGVQWALGNADNGYGVVNFNNSGASLTSLATAALAGGSNPLGISNAASSIAGALLGLGSSGKDSSGNTRFYGAVLQALDSTKSANLLSMPSIMTLNNTPASILVGQNVPFVTGSYTTSGNSVGNPFQTVNRQDVGISLNVIPHIGHNGTVRLEISQEVSSVVDGSLASPIGLTTNKSALNTTILAKDQETVALGGLMRDNSTKGQQKVPGLGSIPVVGRLFRSDKENSEKSNLIIFLQPTILRDSGAVASITERNYNQLRVMQLVIDKNGTIKKIPLSGVQGWDNSSSTSNYQQLMDLNPIKSTPHQNNKPIFQKNITSPAFKPNSQHPTIFEPVIDTPVIQDIHIEEDTDIIEEPTGITKVSYQSINLTVVENEGLALVKQNNTEINNIENQVAEVVVTQPIDDNNYGINNQINHVYNHTKQLNS